jgi:hypothetical protein
LYLKGKGVKADKQKAFELYLTAAKVKKKTNKQTYKIRITDIVFR